MLPDSWGFDVEVVIDSNAAESLELVAAVTDSDAVALDAMEQ